MDKNIKILLIEDEVLNAMSLIMDLKKSGYINSKFVSTSEQALASANSESPDLLISDISLSGGENGIDTAIEIIGTSSIPVIFISGYEADDMAGKMSKLKNYSFLKKPVAAYKLVELIEKL